MEPIILTEGMEAPDFTLMGSWTINLIPYVIIVVVK